MVLLQVIAPQQFITIPWKNGLGETTELAINDGGTLDNFDWRLSIASVINEGVFSDFSGYQRHLVLIAGQGLTLLHGSKDDNKGGNKNSDNLTNLLDIATFDGACKTYGKLTAGAIKDFNLITNKQKITPHVSCYVDAQEVTVNLAKSSLYFAYSLTGVISVEANVSISEQENIIVPQGSLLKISSADEVHHKDKRSFTISGKNMILIQLQPK